MNHNFSLAKALSLSLSADSGLENSLTYINFAKINSVTNLSSLSEDTLVWSKYNEKYKFNF